MYIRWQFKTEGHDIKFGILATDSENIQTVVMPIKKVACHEFEEIGVIKCKHIGECNLFFRYQSVLSQNYFHTNQTHIIFLFYFN